MTITFLILETMSLNVYLVVFLELFVIKYDE